VRLLLDTQALIWLLGGNDKLSKVAADAIRSPDNSLTASVASFWEIAIKLRLGKLRLHAPFSQFITGVLDGYGMNLEPVLPPHTELVATLPLHHRDPFDRMIIAQSKSGGFTVISSDSSFDRYGVPRIW
jgi:PIN domain nuclease of toxin-antitoxin system